MGVRDISSDVQVGTQAWPQVYAFTTPEIKRHDGWIKIGYTERTAPVRVKEQSYTVDVETEIKWSNNAIFEGGGTFTDHDFRAYLCKKGIEYRDDHEWYKIEAGPAELIFFEFRKNRGYMDTPAPIDYNLRDEQHRAVEKAAAYAQNHERAEFLWNCKPRFGKTLATYDLCKVLGAKKVLIVTNRPAIANSWYDDYVKFVGNDKIYGYCFISSVSALQGKPFCMTRDEWNKRVKSDHPYPFIEFVSLQDLKGSVYFGGKFDKLEHIANIEWDLLVIDEAHEGVDTFKTDVAFDFITRKFTLHLSGTPFKAIANDKFPPDAIFDWTYANEQEAKAAWDDPDTPNPYAVLPKLNMYTYKMSDIAEGKAQEGTFVNGKNVDYAFDLNEFFATNDKGFFTYNSEVDRFLQALTTQTKFPFSTPELRDELRHTLWMLNRVDSARALAKKLKKHPVFKDYEVVLAAGDGKIEDEDESVKAFDKVRDAIKTHDKTITLSVGQLTTGVTIPEWTAVLMLSNMQSPALYMQAAFRAQNPCLFQRGTEYFRKENAYVFDFDTARTLRIVEEFANDLYSDTASGGGTAEDRKQRVRTLLNFFPVIGEDEDGEMIPLDAELVLSIPRKIHSQEVVKRGFMCDFLFQNIGCVFRAPSEVLDVIQQFEPYKEPNNKLGIDGNTADDLSLDDDGEVSISDEQVIGTAADLFGDKVYDINEELDDEIEKVVSASAGTPDEDNELLSQLASMFNSTATEPLVASAQDAYGDEVKPRQMNKIKDRIKAQAAARVNRETGSYKVERNIINAQRASELAEAETEAEADEINRKADERIAQARENLVESLKAAKEDLVKGAAETIVREVETAKKQAVKEDIETGIKAHLKGFSRTIPSFLMAYGDENTTLDTFDTVVPTPVFEEVTGITVEQFRFLRDGGDFIDKETGETRHFDGHLFDPVVFDDSVREFIALRTKLANYFDESQAEDIFDYVPPQKTNQIFTPKRVVKQMIDLFEAENPGCFDDPTHTFADLYMKSGLFITEIVKRLYTSAGMRAAFPDDHERLKHILERQVFGIAPTEIIYQIATHFILGYNGEIGGGFDTNFVMVDSARLAQEGTLDDFVDQTFGAKL